MGIGSRVCGSKCTSVVKTVRSQDSFSANQRSFGCFWFACVDDSKGVITYTTYFSLGDSLV